jgi:hypothetical protein
MILTLFKFILSFKQTYGKVVPLAHSRHRILLHIRLLKLVN